MWVVVAVLGAIVIWRVIEMIRRQRKSAIVNDKQVVEELPQAEQLLQQAQDALATGDRRIAIRFAFLALIAHLQGHGKLAYDPTRSNREYQRDLRRWPDVLDGFRQCVVPFERCWYGGQEPALAEVNSVISFCRQQLHAKVSEG